MLSIISIGVANSEHVIYNKELELLSGAGSLPELPFLKRQVTLPVNYLKLTRNKDLRLSEMVATKTISELGVQAVINACEVAEIKPEQIGLLLGDSATLLQSTPSESQRIAGELGLKIPCFDVIGLSSCLPLHLETLSSWKKERLPEYIVIVSTNTPSCFVDYADIKSSFFFGDHATAIVLSAVHDGYFNIKRSAYSKINSFNGFSSADLISIPTSTHLTFNYSEFSKFQLSELSAVCESIKQAGTNISYIVTDQIDKQGAQSVIRKFFNETVLHINTVENYGYAFGSTAGATLSEIKEEVEVGDLAAVVTAGAGLSSGYVIMERE